MYKLMMEVRDREEIAMFKKKTPVITTDEIRMLNIVDSNKKNEIEKSRVYIGYKLIWIIKMFLEGRKFPFGVLDEN
eukprot:CAMPEP_0116887530 /NCGR_PEP_ID=MMETSP0463-20121206/22066_1 /TAXON_ID=181622 /ORGANISM="Strombidinopsis sp, Strain SopsisLIS2011" /LENGTH=75 /DNA_ID=CAMNT_0004550415 /DNA_START=2225 /DNA_END=2452 /DNA_ORIENTATION=+